MYRDDKDAADALAEQLRRDNAQLEDENAKLRAELASRPVESPARKGETKKQRKRRLKAERKAAAQTARTTGRASELPARRPPGIARDGTYRETPVTDWMVRGAAALGVGALALKVNALAYPYFNRGKTSLFMGVFSAVLCQMWNLFAIAEG